MKKRAPERSPGFLCVRELSFHLDVCVNFYRCVRRGGGEHRTQLPYFQTRPSFRI
ncbi:unnamed protein product [Amoebophrya sp. A120]|nr:unnamed protein product [Amoebophrya sp. A120]|eukprot:GSA120T00024885001.1